MGGNAASVNKAVLNGQDVRISRTEKGSSARFHELLDSLGGSQEGFARKCWRQESVWRWSWMTIARETE